MNDRQYVGDWVPLLRPIDWGNGLDEVAEQFESENITHVVVRNATHTFYMYINGKRLGHDDCPRWLWDIPWNPVG